MKGIRFDLVQSAVAIIYTEGGRGPFAVMSEIDLATFTKMYADRGIKIHIFRKIEEKNDE